jgi:hypothetical protein
MDEETIHISSIRARNVGALAAWNSLAPTVKKKILDNGDTPIGYSRETALRREQCDMTPESQSGPFLDGASLSGSDARGIS